MKNVSEWSREELIEYLVENWHEVSDNLPDDITVKRKFYDNNSTTEKLQEIVSDLLELSNQE